MNAADGRYQWLDTFYSGKSTRIVLKKLFADQFIFTPPLIVLFFTSLCLSTSIILACVRTDFTRRITIRFPHDFAGMSLMEAKSDILEECRIKFLHTFQVCSEMQKFSISKIYSCTLKEMFC